MIPFFSQQRENFFFKKKFSQKFNEIISTGRVLQGRHVKSLEAKLSKLFNKKYAICTNSCTDSLFFSILSLKLSYNDEILVSNFSYVASASSIVRAGLKPIFVDLDSDFNMSLEDAQKKITKKTKVLLYVHLFGKEGNLKKIKNFCKKNNLKLIEDIAQTFSSSRKSQKAGSIGDLSCISFDPTKTISAPGSGGAVLTDSVQKYNFIKRLRYHGKNTKSYRFDFLGYNSQMSETTASILLEKLKYNNEWIKKRQAIANYYNKELSKHVKTPLITKNHVFHKYVILTKKRSALLKWLRKNNVEAMIHYNQILSDNEFLKKFVKKKDNFKIANDVSKKALSLPIHPFLKKTEVNKVVKVINIFFNR